MQWEAIRRMVELGAVDGTTGEAVPTVDNFTVAENDAVLEQLRGLVEPRASQENSS